MTSDKLEVAYTTDNAQNAEILRVALQNEGFACEVDGQRQGGLTGLAVLKIHLLVRAEDLEEARAFIEKHKSV